MRNVGRIVLAAVLAACDGGTSSVVDLCQENPDLEECVCSTDVACADLGDGTCLEGFCNAAGRCDLRNICNPAGVTSAEVAVFPQENGNTFVGVEVDLNPGFSEALDLEDAEDEAVPIDDCIEQQFPDITGEPDRRSVGDVVISKGGGAVATLSFDAASGRYEEILTGIAPGDSLDVALAGDGAIGQNTFIGFAALPTGFPQLTGVVGGQLDLSAGLITYAPLVGTYVRISTSFVDPATQQGVSLLCGSDGNGMATIPPAFLSRMPSSGSINLSVVNRQFQPLMTTDGVARRIRSTVRMSKSVPYTKS